MADATLPHDMPALYEPSLFGTYSKKIGMWLFLLSDSLTFGALLYAYSYGRISTPNWPTPFHSESIVNATIMTAFLLTSSLTMVLAVRASVQGDAKAQRLTLFQKEGLELVPQRIAAYVRFQMLREKPKPGKIPYQAKHAS